MDPTPVNQYSFFFFFLAPNSPKLIYIYIKIINKKKTQTEQPTQEKKKKKKKKRTTPTQKKKKSKGGQKLRLWVPYVCLIIILSLCYKLWKLKQPLVVFSFHNSKIRELSDGNRVMETELLFAKQTFCYGSHHF